MSKFFNISCVIAGGANTGLGGCKYDLKNAMGYLFMPHGTKIPATELPELVSYLRTQLKTDSYLDRILLVKDIEGAELANIDAVTGTYGYGKEVIGRPVLVGRNYTFHGVCPNQILTKALNNKEGMYDAVPIFDDNVLAFTATELGSGEPAVKGFALQTLRVNPYQEWVNEEAAQFTLSIVHKYGHEWNENIVAVKPQDGNILSDLDSLQDVALTWIPQTPPVAGVYHVSATAGCGDVNIADIYANELDISTWVATNAVTGTTIDIDSVTTQGGNFVFSFSTGDSDFIAANRIKICGVSVSDLEVAGVSGFEIGCVIVPK